MHRLIVPLALAALCLGPAGAARAEFAGRFSVGQVSIPDLSEPDWVRREGETGVTYLCVNHGRCTLPTAVEIKGVRRTEALPDAFRGGALSPERLMAQGRANAAARGGQFRVAEPYRIGALEGVHMEAEVNLGATAHVVTRWVGVGDRLLDVKATAGDLATARRLSDQAMRSVVPQVFPGR